MSLSGLVSELDTIFRAFWHFSTLFTAEMRDFDVEIFLFSLSRCYVHTKALDSDVISRRKSF